MTGFIAVHCGNYCKNIKIFSLNIILYLKKTGAGYHRTDLRSKYKKLCREACKVATRILNAGGSAFLACQTAVMSKYIEVRIKTSAKTMFLFQF